MGKNSFSLTAVALAAAFLLLLSVSVSAATDRTIIGTLTPSGTAGGIMVPFIFNVNYVDGPGGSKLKDIELSIADSITGTIKYDVDANSISEPADWSHSTDTNISSGKVSKITWTASGANGIAKGDDANFFFSAITPIEGGITVWSWHIKLQDNTAQEDINLSSTTGPAFPNIAEIPFTITPADANRGVSTTFSIDVNNTGGKDVTLNTLSTIEFSDGANTYSAKLSSPTLVPKGVPTTLSFDSNVVPAGITEKVYDPTLNLHGTDSDGNVFAQTLNTASNKIGIGNNAPSASGLFISPSTPNTNDDLNANYTYSDPNLDPESGSQIRWFKDSILQSALNDLKTVSSALTVKGEAWHFTVKPKDGFSFGATATSPAVTILNSAPTANDDNSSTNEDSSVDISVLANDSDPDSDSLAISSVSPPAHGSAVNNSTFVSYTPDGNFNGSDSFTYTISDGSSFSNTATVYVTVNPVNDAPTANDDSATTDEDTNKSVAVLANDSDVDGDSLSIDSITQPVHGTATISGASVIYTPEANFNGSDSFTYTATDGTATATATVTVTVNAVNDGPTAVDDSASLNEDSDVLVDVLANDSDVDSGSLS
ncbi:MAG TPA: Ig-like domain-containing protein, partial [archaeon]|nr:Ig-like domain-containing protein [archaeon]